MWHQNKLASKIAQLRASHKSTGKPKVPFPPLQENHITALRNHEPPHLRFPRSPAIPLFCKANIDSSNWETAAGPPLWIGAATLIASTAPRTASSPISEFSPPTGITLDSTDVEWSSRAKFSPSGSNKRLDVIGGDELRPFCCSVNRSVEWLYLIICKVTKHSGLKS